MNVLQQVRSKGFLPTVARFFAVCLALVTVASVCQGLHLNLATSSLLFVTCVVIVARTGNLGLSVLASVTATLCLAYLAPPTYSLRVDDIFDVIAVATFGVTSIVISELVLRLRLEERKLANDALRESEERLRLAAEAGRTYAFDWDMVTDVIVRSGQCADVFNWMEDPARDTGQQFLARIHPDDRWVYANPDVRFTPRDSAYQNDFRLLRPDGSVVWLETRGRAFFDREGRTLRIMGMAANVTARKEVEEALHRRDGQLAEAQRIAKLGSWRWDVATAKVIWSEELYRISGRDPGLPAPSYEEHPRLFTPDSWERLRHAVEEALHAGTSYELDLQMVRPDGTKRWLLGRGEAQLDSVGRTVQLHGTVQDITERKAVEEMLRDVSGRLITAHEEERTRIARELHDDLSQQMALLHCGLERFEQDEGSFAAPERLRNLVEIAEHVSSDIHDLSHRLHPSRLDVLGLLPSLAGFCREFSKLHQVEVQFTHHGTPENISSDLSLCLFRIAQESLRNVVKHSGAVQATVELLGGKNHIELCVVDTGIGFDSASPKCRQGVGLVSMRERLRLIGGGLTVESLIPHGTRVRARAPLCAIGDPGKQEALKAGA